MLMDRKENQMLMCALMNDYREAALDQAWEIADLVESASGANPSSVKLVHLGTPGSLNDGPEVLFSFDFSVDGDTDLSPSAFSRRYKFEKQAAVDRIMDAMESALSCSDYLMHSAVKPHQSSGYYTLNVRVAMRSDFDEDVWFENQAMAD